MNAPMPSLWQKMNHQYATAFVGIPEQIEPLRQTAHELADQWWKVAEQYKPVGVQVAQAIHSRMIHAGG